MVLRSSPGQVPRPSGIRSPASASSGSDAATAARRVSAYGGRWTPCSVTIARDQPRGRAGRRPGCAPRRPPARPARPNSAIWWTSSAGRCSMTTWAAVGVARSIVEVGAATMNGSPCSRGEHREAVRADLVDDITVGGDPVGANDHVGHLPVGHQAGGHRVADQRERDPLPRQFPGGQPGALQQRAGLADQHAHRRIRRVGGTDDPQRGPDPAGRQRPGVAMGQDACPAVEQHLAVLAHRAAARHLGLVQSPGEQAQARRRRLGRPWVRSPGSRAVGRSPRRG